MKSVIIAGILGSIISLCSAMGLSNTELVEKVGIYGQEPEQRGEHGHGHGHGGGHHQLHYHETAGTELFSGDEWLLALPLILIPLIALACWYFWGGRGGATDDYGWDRMGYTDQNAGAYQGAYGDARGADSLDKSTHQRIFNSIQEPPMPQQMPQHL